MNAKPKASIEQRLVGGSAKLCVMDGILFHDGEPIFQPPRGFIIKQTVYLFGQSATSDRVRGRPDETGDVRREIVNQVLKKDSKRLPLEGVGRAIAFIILPLATQAHRSTNRESRLRGDKADGQATPRKAALTRGEDRFLARIGRAIDEEDRE